MDTYLIAYGADYWMCRADDARHALDQFDNTDLSGKITEIMLCVPVDAPTEVHTGETE